MNYLKNVIPLSEGELIAMLGNLRKEHMNLRFQKKLDSINPSSIKKVRRNIARLETRLVEIKKKNKNA